MLTRGSNPDTLRAPDVAFIARDRLPEVEPRRYPSWVPDLAVEVLTHDDHLADTLDGEDVLPGFRCPLADLW